MTDYDIIIVGAGMAGISAGYELAPNYSVLILEQEEQPGYHSTGRSAAVYAGAYGSEHPAVNALTKASKDFFLNPPQEYFPHKLDRQCGVLFIANAEKQEKLEETYNQLKPLNQGIELIGAEQTRRLHPLIKPEYSQQAIYDREVFEINVHQMQQGYLRGFKSHGGELRTNAKVESAEYVKNKWHIQTMDKTYTAKIIINAAGAWVDELAVCCGVKPIGIQPLRRSAILIDRPPNDQDGTWPMVVEVEEEFYFKPDAGKIMISPANEDLCVPGDVQAEEIDIAYAVHYATEALNVDIHQVEHSWAGFRNFVADRNPVIGFAADHSGFFWLAAQGGYGIQTAPAAASLVASLIGKVKIPDSLHELGMSASMVSPARLEN